MIMSFEGKQSCGMSHCAVAITYEEFIRASKKLVANYKLFNTECYECLDANGFVESVDELRDEEQK